MDMVFIDASQGTATEQVYRLRLGDTPIGDFRADPSETADVVQSGSWRFTRTNEAISGVSHLTASGLDASRWEATRDPVDAAAEDRIRILVKKFESGIDREELARLEILSARLDRLVPQVSQQDVALQESMAQKIEEIRSKVETLSRLGLGR